MGHVTAFVTLFYLTSLLILLLRCSNWITIWKIINIKYAEEESGVDDAVEERRRNEKEGGTRRSRRDQYDLLITCFRKQ